jgi:AraC-like DNA-binding protein
VTSANLGPFPNRRGAGLTVSAWVLPHLVALVASQGCDPAPIGQLPGVTGLDDPDARVPERAAQDAWRLAAALTGDTALGVHLAESLPRGALDLVEYAFRSSASLGVGLERLARYGRVLSDRVAARTETTAKDLLLIVRDTASHPLHPARAEFALAVALRLARDATGVDVTPEQVCFAHPRPADDAEHERFFRVPVHFESGANTMILNRIDGNRPLRGADPALASIVRRRLEKALADRDSGGGDGGGGGMTARVRRILVDDLGQTALSSDAVARSLDISVRTLSRRLAVEGSSFRQILDQTRCELAMALLHDGSLSVGDIAFFLQYSEPAAFHRSFRRWTGQTPREFRRGLAA